MLSSYPRGAAHGEANDRPRQKEAAASRCAALSVRSFVRASGFSHPGRTTGLHVFKTGLDCRLVCLVCYRSIALRTSRKTPDLTTHIELDGMIMLLRSALSLTLPFFNPFPVFAEVLRDLSFLVPPAPLPLIICFCQSFSLANPL